MAPTPPPPPPPPPPIPHPLPLHEFVVVSRIVALNNYLKPLFYLRSSILLLFLSSSRLHPSFFISSSSSTSFSYSHLYLHDKPHLLLLCSALLCELCLSLQSHLSLFYRLRLVERVAHPSRLFLPHTPNPNPNPNPTPNPIPHVHDDGHGGPRQLLDELPPVDVFVTTADPLKEPPLVTLNTLLSALALDYSPRRLSCYVSDDAGSLLNLWAIKLAAAFAIHWVPFCRRFPSITPRAPGPHFAKHKHAPDSTHVPNASSSHASGFAAEWTTMKARYKELERRVTSMTQRYGDHRSKAEALKMMLADVMMETGLIHSYSRLDNNNTNNNKDDEGYMGRLKRSVLSESWAAVDYDSRHHHAYCEVLIDKSQEEEEEEGGLPCLVYMSREKSLQRKHHYKAGNMNALIRVSGIFTNAPFIINLDCDTYANDGNALLQAMCFFMDSSINPQLGFVQFPQIFEGMEGDDSFTTVIEVVLKGWDSCQGPPYCGTSCILKREALYGKTPDGICLNSLKSEDLGTSAVFNNCAARILSTKPSDDGENDGVLRGDPFVEEAIELLGCRYEDGTNWGEEAGLIYGSVTEDVLTGLKLHGRGWKSVFCSPKHRPAFLGRFPVGSEDMLTTRKRWSAGFLEVMVGTDSPFSFTRLPKLSMVQRLNYIYLFNSIAVGIPSAMYALLPCASLLIGRPLFPKMEENPMWLLLGLAAFVSAYGCTRVESMVMGMSLQAWWMGEKMDALAATSSSLFAAYDVLKKLMGISDIKFEITPKDKLVKEEDTTKTKTKTKTKREEAEAEAAVSGGVVVNSKLKLFVPPTVIVMLNLAALSQFLLSSLLNPSLWSTSSAMASSSRRRRRVDAVMKVEAWCCAWVLLLLHPIVKGLFLWCRGHRRSPLALHSSIVFLSSACSFIAFCIISLMTGKL